MQTDSSSKEVIKNFKLFGENSYEEVIFAEIYADELRTCKLGAKIKLWTIEDLDFINGYRPDSIGGQGKVFKLMKLNNKYLLDCLAMYNDVWIEVISVNEAEVKIGLRYL